MQPESPTEPVTTPRAWTPFEAVKQVKHPQGITGPSAPTTEGPGGVPTSNEDMKKWQDAETGFTLPGSPEAEAEEKDFNRPEEELLPARVAKHALYMERKAERAAKPRFDRIKLYQDDAAAAEAKAMLYTDSDEFMEYENMTAEELARTREGVPTEPKTPPPPRNPREVEYYITNIKLTKRHKKENAHDEKNVTFYQVQWTDESDRTYTTWRRYNQFLNFRETLKEKISSINKELFTVYKIRSGGNFYKITVPEIFNTIYNRFPGKTRPYKCSEKCVKGRIVSLERWIGDMHRLFIRMDGEGKYGLFKSVVEEFFRGDTLIGSEGGGYRRRKKAVTKRRSRKTKRRSRKKADTKRKKVSKSRKSKRRLKTKRRRRR